MLKFVHRAIGNFYLLVGGLALDASCRYDLTFFFNEVANLRWLISNLSVKGNAHIYHIGAVRVQQEVCVLFQGGSDRQKVHSLK